MRIGFLFNHDQIHQIAHSLPIALKLVELDRSLEILIATTNDRLRVEVERLCSGEAGAERVELVDLRPRSLLGRGAAALLDFALPASKLVVYRDNLDFFRSLDALVVAEKTSAILKSSYRLNNLKLLHTRHGAGDRAIGFNRQSAAFDLVLVSGRKIRDRLVREAGVPLSRIAMVGYPKFDLVSRRPNPLPMQVNGRPTVLYNPHVSPHLSSWYRHGRQVLDFFAENPAYNLIFAPHIMLFERPFAVTIDKLRVERPGRVAERYRHAPNIHIDLGSWASTDMTYTMAADLYLGDVSSQIYEFLLRRRPCLFLNSHGVGYEGDVNYTHWRTGAVIGTPAPLPDALAAAWRTHPDYLAVQSDLFDQSFDLTDQPSSLRAAQAVLSFLPRRASKAQRAARSAAA